MPRQRQAVVRSPEAAEFISWVKEILGCETTADLAQRIGWWNSPLQRKLYRWALGEYAPRFNETITLLRAAGLLRERPEASAVASEDARRAAEELRSASLHMAELVDQLAEALATQGQTRDEPQHRGAAARKRSLPQ